VIVTADARLVPLREQQPAGLLGAPAYELPGSHAAISLAPARSPRPSRARLDDRSADADAAASAAGGGRAACRPRVPVADAGIRSQHGAGEVVQRVPVTTFDAWAAKSGLDQLDVVKIDV
jgi:hypothetical protein